MSEENKAVARRFYEEVFNKKNLDAIDELCAPGFVDHTAPLHRTLRRASKDSSSYWGCISTPSQTFV